MTNNNKPLEYQMTKATFNAILSLRSEEEKKHNPYEYVMNILNESQGLRGTIKHIFIVE